MVMQPQVEIILASNRGPLSFSSGAGGHEPHPGIGAVAEMLEIVAQDFAERACWVACAVTEDDRAAVRTVAAAKAVSALNYGVKFIAPPERQFRGYYDELSNRVLWFACHDLWADAKVPPPARGWLSSLHDYDAVNRSFAETVAGNSPPSAPAHFNDYHLWMAPRHLRSLRSNQPSSIFTHTPWSARGFSKVPEELVRALVTGMGGADLIGFHVPAWAIEFLETCRSLGIEVDVNAGWVKADGRLAWVRTYPGTIDPERVRALAESTEATRWARELRGMVPGLLIVRSDRVEPSKNALRGFLAFEQLLDRGDPVAQRARFFAFLLPRRQNMGEYIAYREEVERVVRRVNAHHPEAIQLFVGDDRARSFAALREFDVLFINSVRDGMNLVAKEGAILNERNGILLISATTGAAGELAHASVIIRDPLDVDETAAALARALRVRGPERKRRAREARIAVARRTPPEWMREQLRDLKAITVDGEPRSEPAW